MSEIFEIALENVRNNLNRQIPNSRSLYDITALAFFYLTGFMPELTIAEADKLITTICKERNVPV